MARHTTWRVGGPADWYLIPQDAEDLAAALRWLEHRGIGRQVIGGGSNLLVRDGGIRGAVLDLKNLAALEFDGCSVRAQAGLSLGRLIRKSVERELGGLEELWGIPGTLGGALAGNAGAGSQDLAAVVEHLELCGPEGPVVLGREAFEAGYRFLALPEGAVITAAGLRLAQQEPSRLQERLRYWQQRRRSTQETGAGNAGSVFKNPPGQSAWKLIDEAGFRGRLRGGARVSEKHTNFILNEGEARAADIEELMADIAAAVLANCGIRLEPEVKIWGEPAGARENGS